MGIDFIAVDSTENRLGWKYSCKWLQEDAPRKLFWESEYGAGKETLSNDEIRAYQQELKSYTETLHFVKADPEDEENYDKWASENSEDWIDWDIYKRIQHFVSLLQDCIDRGLSARWSF